MNNKFKQKQSINVRNKKKLRKCANKTYLARKISDLKTKQEKKM